MVSEAKLRQAIRAALIREIKDGGKDFSGSYGSSSTKVKPDTATDDERPTASVGPLDSIEKLLKAAYKKDSSLGANLAAAIRAESESATGASNLLSLARVMMGHHHGARLWDADAIEAVKASIDKIKTK